MEVGTHTKNESWLALDAVLRLFIIREHAHHHYHLQMHQSAKSQFNNCASRQAFILYSLLQSVNVARQPCLITVCPQHKNISKLQRTVTLAL